MKFYLIAFVLIFTSTNGISEDIKVQQIDFVGLQRISLGSVLNTIGIEKNDQVSELSLSTSIKRLYDTGYFKDISLSRDLENGLLVYDVVEQPAISELNFNGNKLIKTSVLEKVFTDSDIKTGEVLSRGKLEAIIVELERQYASMGHYSAEIDTEILPLPNNRIKLELNVSEGKEAKIASIAITGNESYSDKILLKNNRLRSKKTASLLQLMGKRTNYSSEAVRSDQEKLAAWYLDRGFLKYELISTQVALSAKKDAVHLTFNISEGSQYRVESLILSGDLVGDEQQLNKLAAIKQDTVFSRNDLVSVQKSIQSRLSDLGYAFPKIRLLTDVNEELRTVGLNFRIEPGQRTYVRRINISGNLSTSERVIRRELSQMEGALASGSNISASQSRLQRVGYFKGIQIETRPVENTPDQVDLNITLEEIKDGTLTGSIGWADPGGAFIAAEYEQKNFQGSGKDVAMSITSNSYQKELEFSYINPYLTQDAVSLEQDLFFTETDNSDISENDFATNKWGGGVKVGYPLTNNQRISFGLDYTYTELFANNPAQEIDQFITANGSEFSNLELTTRWNYSSLNGGFLATRGQSHALSLNATLPTSDLSYYKANYRGRFYMPVIEDDYVFRLRTSLGYGDGFGDTPELPFFENFLAGGVSSVRGYDYGSLGPKSTPALLSTDVASAIGGNINIEYGLDFIFPMPIVKDRSQFRPSLFVDAGNVFTTNCLSGNANCQTGVDLDEIRYSAGFELNWMTPIAPLRFIWAWPLNAEADDNVSNFVFTFGYSI